MAGIITEEIIAYVGRPRNSVKFCKVCNTELSFENCRETKRGSGSLRSTCRDCEKEKDRAKHKAKYRIKHKRNRVSRGPAFTELLNKRRMAAQSAKFVKIDNKDFIIFEDKICEECGGIYRYDELTLERVCESCGIVDCEPVLWDAVGEFTGRQITSTQKSDYAISYEINRDKEIDVRRANDDELVHDRYLPSLSGQSYDHSLQIKYNRYSNKQGGTYDEYYSRCYRGTTQKPIERIEFSQKNNCNYIWQEDIKNISHEFVMTDDLRSRIIAIKKSLGLPEFVNYPGEIDLDGNVIS